MSIIYTNRNSTIKLSEQIETELNEYSETRVKEGAPNPPELVDGMIAVIYDETKSEWVKANIEDGSWYNYSEQKWANAVTVTNSNRNNYIAATPGTTIPMNVINTMWVWIPRYSYQRNGNSFDIKWVRKSVIDKDDYYTSSAFCWGDKCDITRDNTSNKELSGIWVAKFELSATDTDNIKCQSIDDKVSCNRSDIIPKSKPNEVSWRNANVASFFNSIKNQMNSNNGEKHYGFSGNYNTHMIKNTEWGAVAYLTHSKYGKGNNEVSINNCYLHYTGIGSDTIEVDEYCNNTYETAIGTKASTTGNIYGIYDMSGGSAEYVMANVVNEAGENYVSNPGTSDSSSGFAGKSITHTELTGHTFPSNKYYNAYIYNTETSTISSILGDAIEDPQLYDDKSSPKLSTSFSWYRRGGYYNEGTLAGIFSYSSSDGSANNVRGTRATLISTK